MELWNYGMKGRGGGEDDLGKALPTFLLRYDNNT